MSSERKVHNKSGRTELTVCSARDEERHLWRETLRVYKTTVAERTPGLCVSDCLTPRGRHDGRLSVYGSKVCYAYQLVAYDKFGRDAMMQVTPAKKQDDLVVSHLCGARNCMTLITSSWSRKP